MNMMVTQLPVSAIIYGLYTRPVRDIEIASHYMEQKLNADNHKNDHLSNVKSFELTSSKNVGRYSLESSSYVF